MLCTSRPYMQDTGCLAQDSAASHAGQAERTAEVSRLWQRWPVPAPGRMQNSDCTGRGWQCKNRHRQMQ